LVKTNLLNLLAHWPTLTIEKPLTSHWSIGISYVTGEFNYVLYTDCYRYNGFVLDTRYYIVPLQIRAFSPYISTYVGNLNRKIRTEYKTSDIIERLLVDKRDFSGKSARFGATIGGQYLFTNRIVIDGHIGLGYGKYYQQFDKADPGAIRNGYRWKPLA
jgi:hypothetical protein